MTGAIASSGTIALLRNTTDERIASIRNIASDNDSIKQTGSLVKNIYVSSSTGSDAGEGTEASPYKTLAKAAAQVSKKTYKYNIFLKRGDTWRGEQISIDGYDNITIAAYGEGAKPLLLGYKENVGGSANASKWTNVGGNIWKLDLDSTCEAMDIGNIVVKETADGEETFLRKVVQLYVKNNDRTTDFSHPTDVQKVAFNSYTDLYEDNTFFQPKGGDLYVYSTSNPATRYASMELAPLLKLIWGRKTDNLTIDNIAFGHTGSHAIALEVGSQMVIQNITVQNCEFNWIGGSISDYHKTDIAAGASSYDLRYGNAIEIYGGCDGFVAKNNYIHQVYDTGITFQMTVNDDTGVYAKDVLFTENVIENCEYSIEYFLTCVNNTASNNGKITNFEISDNLMWNSGYGLSEMRGAWERGYSTHVKAQKGNPCNWAENYVISGNTFVGIRDNFLSIRTSIGGTGSLPILTNNTFYGNYDFDGTAVSGKGCRLGEVRAVPIDDTTEIRVSYDQNCDAYLTEQGVTHSGNKFMFCFGTDATR